MRIGSWQRHKRSELLVEHGKTLKHLINEAMVTDPSLDWVSLPLCDFSFKALHMYSDSLDFGQEEGTTADSYGSQPRSKASRVSSTDSQPNHGPASHGAHLTPDYWLIMQAQGYVKAPPGHVGRKGGTSTYETPLTLDELSRMDSAWSKWWIRLGDFWAP